jgi:hypothetical protein
MCGWMDTVPGAMSPSRLVSEEMGIEATRVAKKGRRFSFWGYVRVLA